LTFFILIRSNYTDKHYCYLNTATFRPILFGVPTFVVYDDTRLLQLRVVPYKTKCRQAV